MKPFLELLYFLVLPHILLAHSQFSFQSFFLLLFFFHQLLFHVRVSQHVILWKSVDLEIRVVLHHWRESFVFFHWSRYLLHSGGKRFVQIFIHLSLDFCLQVHGIDFAFELVVESQVHQIPVHVLFEHFGVDQVVATQFINLLFADELVLVVNDLFLLFLELFCDIFDKGHPFGSRAELRNEKTADFRVF